MASPRTLPRLPAGDDVWCSPSCQSDILGDPAVTHQGLHGASKGGFHGASEGNYTPDRDLGLSHPLS